MITICSFSPQEIVSKFVIPAKSGSGRPAAEDPDNVPAKLVPDCDQGAGNQAPNDVIVAFWIPDIRLRRIPE